MTFVALLALFATAKLDVHSSAPCPSTEDVLAHLAPLLPPGEHASQTGRDVANIEVTGVSPDGTSQLRIELTGKDGVRIGERDVVGRGTCSDMAETVAAVLAAWETDPSPALAAVEAPNTEARAFAPADTKAPLDKTTPLGGWNVTVAAGGGIALAGGLAGAVIVRAAAGPSESHWQVQLDGTVESNRQIDLAAGHVDWHHATGGVALGWRALWPRLVLATDLGAIAGWASLAGNDFDQNRERTAFEYGVAAGARVGRNWGRWQLWAEIRPRLWLRGQQAVLTNPSTGQSTTADVPIWDVLVCVGASMAVLR